MEFLAAAGIFALVRHWTRSQCRAVGANGIGMLAAAAIWLNPALIWDAHCWPQWDAWLLPFLVWAMVAASGGYWFLTGVLIAVGAMFKGQILLGAPVLLLWPMWQGRWSTILRELIGFSGAAALCAGVWLLRRDGAVMVTALLWVLGIALALGLTLLQRSTSNRYVKFTALGLCAGLMIWPMITIGAIAIGCALLAAGVAIAAAMLLPLRSQGYVATACLSAALFLCAPIFGGSMAWFDIAFVSGTRTSPVAHLGPTCNLPAILESQWAWGAMDTVFTVPPGRFGDALGATIASLDRNITYTPHDRLAVPLKYVLLACYFVTLIVCGLGAAIQDERRSPRILLALVSPWVLMFCLLPQMHERYLVWGAALSAVTVAISPGCFILGLLITAIAWSQEAQGMMTQPQDSAVLRLMIGCTPGVGWALLLISMIYLYQAFASTGSGIRSAAQHGSVLRG